ncbi:major facilitator superfamily domain-containing protein [Aspergillus alliaceus]|uniref:major facilitator superfamily domain-containing protein n=1 Tax=Petromyces alliaceus TaxID=209559 RepID=UPI0012A5773E|nr:major facilitator superfamily domain-containing protein [Aspergillus alliaceus]KAB8230416.1 major facilitator superfamily domain-containing protein [Aspergillus alliaceus]
MFGKEKNNEKKDVLEVECIDEKAVPTHGSHQPTMPASLAALSESEYHRVGRKAILKLDSRVMPCLVIMFIMNFLDRQNIASAKLAGVEEDLGMNDVQYQTSISILFIGYILMQVPSNIVVGKIRMPGTYICASMALWGAISACMASVHNYSGILVCRFFLGFVEAIFFPGALFYLSLFYNRKQYALRTAILYSGSQIGNAIGGIFAIGILELDGSHGLEGWRWLFLVEGVITVGLAIILAFILPNSLKTLLGFTEVEKEYLQWNFESDQGQQDNADEVSAWKGVMMAVTDPKTWLLMATLYCIYICSAVTNFFPSVVATLGYSRNTTYGLTAPPYILSVVAMITNGFHSDKKQERYLHIVCPMAVCLVANIIAVSSLNTAARYVAMMLMPGSFYSASTILMSWVAGSVSQPAIKRASAIALINAICNTPNVWTSYLYFSAPRYLVAFLVNLAAAAGAIVLATVTKMYLRRQNHKLANGMDTGRSGPTEAQKVAGFRYTL